MTKPIALIAGLGNVGNQYHKTRHNAGFWFIDALADRYRVSFKTAKKYHGEWAEISVAGHNVWLLKPATLMNLSGKSVAPLANFYKLLPEQLLVVHDEMSIPPGAIKLKHGGSHSGHNGLKSIDSLYGNGYHRLRIGIDHPGDRSLVTPYVLGVPSREDRVRIDQAIDFTVEHMRTIIQADWETAKRLLHNFKPTDA